MWLIINASKTNKTPNNPFLFKTYNRILRRNKNLIKILFENNIFYIL